MGLVRTIRRLIGNETVTVIHRPDSKPSLLNPQETARDKAIRELTTANKDGDTEKALKILEGFESRHSIRDLFEAHPGIEDREALNLLKQIALESKDDEIGIKARELIFAYAHEKAPQLIKDIRSDETATEVIDGFAAYLGAGTDEDKQASLSKVAQGIGYHIIGLRQKVILDPNPEAKASKANNLMWQLYNHKGIGSVIYALISESDFYDDNKELLRSRFANGEATMDASLNGDLAQANLLYQTRRSVLGIFGSWSSCNFNFSQPRLDASGVVVTDPNTGRPIRDSFYTLDDLLKDACKEGPAEANRKFIDAYVKLVEYKERLREDPVTNAGEIADVEKQLTKSLKFLFDDNKMQATGDEGNMIYEALQGEMRKNGTMQFLNSLFKAVTGPNQVAEIASLQTDYTKAFGAGLTYIDSTGTQQRVETMQEYKLAREQRQAQYKNNLIDMGNKVNLTITFNQNSGRGFIPWKADELASIKANFNNIAKRYEEAYDNAGNDTTLKEKACDDFKQECNNLGIGIDFSGVSANPGERVTIKSLISLATRQLPETFADLGGAVEVHIKKSGAVKAIDTARNKETADLSFEENVVLNILKEDQDKVQRHNNGAALQGQLDALIHSETGAYPDVHATLVASFEIMRRVDENDSLSDDQKNGVKEYIFLNILGIKRDDAVFDHLSDPRNNPIDQNFSKELYSLSHQIQVLKDKDKTIRDDAQHQFSKEIVRFVKIAIPSVDIDSLDGNIQSLNDIVANLDSMQGLERDSVEYKEFELKNLKLLGIDINDPNSIIYDDNISLGTLIDPSQDIGMIELFVETLRRIFDYIKMMNSTTLPDRSTKSERRKSEDVNLTAAI